VYKYDVHFYLKQEKASIEQTRNFGYIYENRRENYSFRENVQQWKLGKSENMDSVLRIKIRKSVSWKNKLETSA
jgi:hypothetical protein